MEKNEAHRFRAQLAALPHYHVVALYDGDEVNYSDGFTWPGARAFAADLIAQPMGAAIPEAEPEALWIVEGEQFWCPLAHGDGAIAADEQTTAEFLAQAMRQRPYWSA